MLKSYVGIASGIKMLRLATSLSYEMCLNWICIEIELICVGIENYYAIRLKTFTYIILCYIFLYFKLIEAMHN